MFVMFCFLRNYSFNFPIFLACSIRIRSLRCAFNQVVFLECVFSILMDNITKYNIREGGGLKSAQKIATDYLYGPICPIFMLCVARCAPKLLIR